MNSGSKQLGYLAVACALSLTAASCKNVSSTALRGAVETTIPYEASLRFPADTGSLVYDLPNQSSGPTTVYVIPVGELIQNYAHDYIGTAFAGAQPVEVDIRIDEFRVRNYRAFVAASFEVKRQDRVVFGESYSAAGRPQQPPEDWESGMEVRQRVDLTTDQAMRSIFSQFLRDARKKQATW